MGNGYQVTFSVTSRWLNGYVADITIKNTGDNRIDNWCMSFFMEDSITNIWNAKLESRENKKCVVKNNQYNQDIEVGESVTFGILVNEPFQQFPSDYTMVGNPKIIEKNDYSIKYIVNDDWGSGFSASLVIYNKSNYDFEDWTLQGEYENEIDTIWNGQIREYKENHYVISGSEYAQNLCAGDSVSIGFNCMGNSSVNFEQLELDFIQTNIDDRVSNSNTIGYTIEDIQKDACIKYSAGDCDTSVTDDITFSVSEQFAKYVSWESSNTGIINVNGKVTRTDKPTEVVITKRIKFKGEQREEKITLCVAGRCIYEPENMQDFVISEIKQMNISDDDFEIIINEEGYIEEIYGMYSNITVDCWETALYSLYNIKTALGIDNPFQELIPKECYHDNTGYSYSFQQVNQGLPVFNRGLVICCDEQGKINMLSSSYLSFERIIDVEPKVSYGKAVSFIENSFGKNISIGNNEEILYVVNDYGIESTAWLIPVAIYEQCEEIEVGSYIFLIDGKDGTILDYISNLQSADIYPCTGFDINGDERSFLGTKSEGKYYMEDIVNNIEVHNGLAVDKKHANRVSSDWSDTGWDSGAVSAMANMKAVMDYYGELTHNRRKSYDGKGGKINIYLSNNASTTDKIDYPDNASWDFGNKGFTFGIGTGTIKKQNELSSYSFKKGIRVASFDIVVHEYTHAVFGAITDNKIFYYSEGIPESVREGYSDIMACFADGNWRVAEDIADEAVGDGCMRNIARPNLTGNPFRVQGKYYECNKRSIFSSYMDELSDGHCNSTVLSHAAYLMLSKLEKLDSKEDYWGELEQLWFSTMFTYGEKKIDFYKVRKKVIAKAKAYRCFDEEEVSVIREAFTECGITKAKCKKDSTYFKRLRKSGVKSSMDTDNMQLAGQVVKADENYSIGDNLPLSSVQIKVCTMDEEVQGAFGYTDIKGGYEIDTEDFEECVMTFSKSGYLSEKMYISESDSELQNAIYCRAVELIPEEKNRWGSASGTVKSATTAKKIENLKLNIRRGIHNIYTDIVMEVTTDYQGQYSVRLPAGNYTVEIVDDSEEYETSYFNIKILGETEIASQDGVVFPKMNTTQLRSVLTWGLKPSGLNSHMICKFSNSEETDVYHADKKGYCNENVVCQMNVRNLSTSGLETITLQGAEMGNFDYYIYHCNGAGTLSASNASVCLYLQGTEGMKMYTFHVPEGIGRYWTVYRYNSATEIIVPVNEIS